MHYGLPFLRNFIYFRLNRARDFFDFGYDVASFKVSVHLQFTFRNNFTKFRYVLSSFGDFVCFANNFRMFSIWFYRLQQRLQIFHLICAGSSAYFRYDQFSDISFILRLEIRICSTWSVVPNKIHIFFILLKLWIL